MIIIFRKFKAWLKDALHHRSQYTTLCWTSALALLVNAVILIIAFFTLNETWYIEQFKSLHENFCYL